MSNNEHPITPMTNPTWYLLYGGTSIDGRGMGDYIGRTTDKTEAVRHFRKAADSPYSIGHVLVVTDQRTFRLFRESDLKNL